MRGAWLMNHGIEPGVLSTRVGQTHCLLKGVEVLRALHVNLKASLGSAHTSETAIPDRLGH